MAGWLECSRERKRYYTWLEIDKRLSRVVPELRRFAPDVIVAIGGGGFIPARVLRSSLKVPIVAVSLELYDASDAIGQEVTVRQWFDGTDSTAALVRGKRVLVVDEVDDSRTTLQFACEMLERRNGPAEMCVCVVHNKRREKVGVLPPRVRYVAAEEVPDEWIVYPWDAAENRLTPAEFDTVAHFGHAGLKIRQWLGGWVGRSGRLAGAGALLLLLACSRGRSHHTS